MNLMTGSLGFALASLSDWFVVEAGKGKMREMNESVGFEMMKMAQLWVDFILKEQTTYKPYNLQTN